MAILIRTALPGDARAIATIHVLAWQAGYRGLLPDSVLIVPEETYLAAKFGTEYTDYTMTVRRWLGHR